MTVHLGIDLGTTYSTVAAARNGRVELLSLGTRGAAVPSVVFVRDDGPPLVGEAAEARAQGDPSRFAREFKRRLGDPDTADPRRRADGRRAPVGVRAGLPRRARHRAARRGAGERSCSPTRRATPSTASTCSARPSSLAGLSDVRLLAEPRAAAIHYAADNRVQDGETVAVYDFGGGTFDTALVRRAGRRVRPHRRTAGHRPLRRDRHRPRRVRLRLRRGGRPDRRARCRGAGQPGDALPAADRLPPGQGAALGRHRDRRARSPRRSGPATSWSPAGCWSR